MALVAPYEILELGDGESKTLTVVDWELGEMDITPRDGRPPRHISVLRVRVPPGEKATVPHYWDVTSLTLIGSWIPFLPAPGMGVRRYRITKRGTGPSARFTLEALP